MSFVYDNNRNNTCAIMRNEFAGHNKKINHLLPFFSLFVDINKITKPYNHTFPETIISLRKEMKLIVVKFECLLTFVSFQYLFKL